VSTGACYKPNVRRIGRFIALASLGTGPAYADHTSLHVTAAGDVAVTDNLFSVSRDANPESDAYASIRPGLIGTWETPRMIQALAAEAEILEYATHNNTDPALLLRGRWDSLWLIGPRSEFGLGGDASTGRVAALTTNAAADQANVIVTPGGDAEVRNANAAQRLSWQSTKATRTSETAYAHWGATTDNAAMPTTTDSVDTGLNFGFDRIWQQDDLGLEVGGSYVKLELVAPVGAGATQASRYDQELNPHATVQWRHDYSKRWSTSLGGGVVYVNPFGTDKYNPGRPPSKATAAPVFNATLAYTGDWGGAVLTVSRAVAPNLLIAQNTVNEGAFLRMSLPLPWLELSSRSNPHFTAVGTFGVARTQLIDPDTAQLQGAFDLVRTDAALQYRPRPSITYALRYEFAYQHGDTVGAMIEPSYFRNTVYFEFSFRYPEVLATQVPRRDGSVRADQADLAPVGAEPVVPDAAEPAPPSD
jgi:hypothetical protein